MLLGAVGSGRDARVSLENNSLGWAPSSVPVPARGGSAPPPGSRRLFALTLWLVPVNWICGTSLLWLYMLAAALLPGLRRPSGPEWTLIGLSGALVLGLLAAGGGLGADRVLASLYNLSLIAALIVVFNAARSLAAEVGARGLDPIWRGALAFFLVQIAWVAAVELVVRGFGVYQIEFRTLLLGAAGTLPGVLAEYSRAVVVITDWTKAGAGSRVHGFGLYATEGALLVALAGLLAAVPLARRRGGFLLVSLAETASVMALVLMASRTTLAGYLVSSVLLVGLAGRRLPPLLVVGLPVMLFGAGLVALVGPALVADLFTTVSESRAGSSEQRFLSYRLAIEMVLQHNPLTGLGIKPRDPSLLDIPIGSHSSFVSMFTKGGFLALTLFIVFYVLVIVRIIGVQLRLIRGDARADRQDRVELVYLSRAAFVLLVWWVTEDFDAPAHAALLGGLCLGLLWGRSDVRSSATQLTSGGGPWHRACRASLESRSTVLEPTMWHLRPKR